MDQNLIKFTIKGEQVNIYDLKQKLTKIETSSNEVPIRYITVLNDRSKQNFPANVSEGLESKKVK